MSVLVQTSVVRCDARGCDALEEAEEPASALRARLREERSWRWRRAGKAVLDFCPKHAAQAVAARPAEHFQPALF